MSGGRRRDNRPKSGASAPPLPYEKPPNYDEKTPIFCLAHLHSDFDLKTSALDKDQKSGFADTLQSLASLTWSQIKRAPRHGLGFEKIPVKSLQMTLPAAFVDEEEVLVFRYHKKHPMAGVRVQATFHILALERAFGDLYDHGS